jgi:hypothetical protein
MNKLNLLTLVLSSHKAGFWEIYQNGQLPTWISHYRSRGYKIIPYFSEPRALTDPLSLLLEKTDRSIGRAELFNKLHLNQFRIPRRRPSKNSKLLWGESSARDVSHFSSTDSLSIDIPDSLASIGVTTLLSFKFALENYQFDYLARTNTSSYLNLDLLSQLVDANLSFDKNRVLALHGSWGKKPYPSGALYVLSRRQVESVVSQADEWIHDYIDDVALGLLLNLEKEDYIPIIRYEFEASSSPHYGDILTNVGYAHYRCKGSTYSETIQNLHLVHDSVLKLTRS